ncbi:MAG: tryptophan--tRNA ligase, partial [Candidatus Nomurabacteria bacterium]|nr:tryptophan--tRNA ligase [Candidatus Nomurabacteria bacterium]
TQPGISSLLQILAILSGRTQADVNAEWVGQTSYGDFKRTVADAVRNFLTDFQVKVAAISDQEVLEVLTRSENAMNQVANRKLNKVQTALGLRKG